MGDRSRLDEHGEDLDEPGHDGPGRAGPVRTEPVRGGPHRADYIELRPERGRLSKVAFLVAIVLTVAAVVVIGGRSWYQGQVDPPGDPGAAVMVTIPEGTSIAGVGTLLEDEGVITNAWVFRLWVRDKSVEAQAGDHRFREDSSFEEALQVIRKGPLPPTAKATVTVPEGLTVREIAASVVEQLPELDPEAVAAALADPAVRSRFQPPDQPSLEGMLFPSSYELGSDVNARQLVERFIAEMEQVATGAGIDGGVSPGADPVPDLTPYEILIVASLIQAESGNPDESPKIARVIYNRLGQGMPLGIDATSRYWAELTGEEVDFESDSPYNTRRDPGLPPTPIAAPGAAAILAALGPADGPWIYYVLEAEGRHFFTASNAEFLDKKQECEAKGLGCG